MDGWRDYFLRAGSSMRLQIKEPGISGNQLGVYIRPYYTLLENQLMEQG
jgi:hypothetical protein